ncbi:MULTISPECIES: hypothetical protein [unclassified Enterococcus]|uniref:hypothetical protein n=1 Tax=unclassified Enterococcus TaxID=2608891 RepID=UPI0006B8F01A|nr:MULTISPECIES: hypothetical protein [unclassified Enterococcus]KPG74209.1 hypothetical protein AEQ18_00135 [Enterococcus sp. RIT-PI-f]
MIIGLIVGHIFDFSPFIFAAIIYGVMFIFMIPSDSFFSSSVDYQTKTLNPTFRPAKFEMKTDSLESTTKVIVVFLALIICLIIVYYQYV